MRLLPFLSDSTMDFFSSRVPTYMYTKVIDVKYRKSGLKIYNVWNKG
jgi:hypothetical protein